MTNNTSPSGLPPESDIPIAAAAPDDPRYVLAPKPLDAGGMGEVFLARDTVLNRRIAVKVIRAKLAPHSDISQRFHREARITAQLQHPGIPPIHDLGTLPDGRPFIAMKLIQGKTLDALLKERRTLDENLPRFIQVFAFICQAMAYVHSRGVVHRDLKPANVMVGAFNEVQVMDWGIAKLLPGAGRESLQAENPSTTLPPDPADTGRGSDSFTQLGSAFGTPAYMPPEQANGELHRVGPWSDTFALGGLLVCILTGKPTYTGLGRDEIVQKARTTDVREAFARLEACGAARELIDLAKRCLAARPEDRPPSGLQVAAAVEAYRDGVEKRIHEAETERAAQAARAEEATLRAEAEQERAEEATRRIKAERAKAEEHRKRRRVQFALAASIALLLIGGISFAWWNENQSAKRALADGLRKAEDERNAGIARERDARNGSALQSALERCESALRGENAALAEAALAEAEKRAFEGASAEQKTLLTRLRDETKLLRSLDTIDDLEWKIVNEELTDRSTMIREFSAAFRQFGIQPGSGSVADQARRITSSRFQDRILGELDRWHAMERTEALLPLLQAIDGDAFRNEIRLAIAQENVAKLRALASDPIALQQPPHFCIMLGNLGSVPWSRRDRILLSAHWRKPNDFVLLMSLSNLYYGSSQGLAGQRARYCTAAIALRPDSLTAWNNLGNALLDYGDMPHSVAALRVAVRLDPKSQTAHFNLGVALSEVGDLDGAIAEYRAEIDLNPNTAESYVNLASAMEKKGDTKAAIALYKLAMRVHPQDHKPHLNLSLIYFKLEDYPEALRLATVATTLAPKSSLSFCTLGKIQANMGDLAAAKQSFEKAASLAPKNADAVAGLGVVQELKGDLDGAVKKFEEALVLEPKNLVATAGLERVKKAKAGKK